MEQVVPAKVLKKIEIMSSHVPSFSHLMTATIPTRPSKYNLSSYQLVPTSWFTHQISMKK